MYTFETVANDIMEMEGFQFKIPEGFYGILSEQGGYKQLYSEINKERLDDDDVVEIAQAKITNYLLNNFVPDLKISFSKEFAIMATQDLKTLELIHEMDDVDPTFDFGEKIGTPGKYVEVYLVQKSKEGIFGMILLGSMTPERLNVH